MLSFPDNFYRVLIRSFPGSFCAGADLRGGVPNLTFDIFYCCADFVSHIFLSFESKISELFKIPNPIYTKHLTSDRPRDDTRCGLISPELLSYFPKKHNCSMQHNNLRTQLVSQKCFVYRILIRCPGSSQSGGEEPHF